MNHPGLFLFLGLVFGVQLLLLVFILFFFFVWWDQFGCKCENFHM
ncbi:E5 transforming protein [Deltapapillomavirus 2]|nr:E5 transforming protein [Deltapapillomavirus 2]